MLSTIDPQTSGVQDLQPLGFLYLLIPVVMSRDSLQEAKDVIGAFKCFSFALAQDP